MATYTQMELLSLFARGFHFCFFFIIFLFFALIKREKANFTYLFGACGFMLMASLGVGTLARFANVKGITLDIDEISDLAIVPTFTIFEYSLIKQSTKLWKLIMGWLVIELPIIICLIGHIIEPNRIFFYVGHTYILVLMGLALLWGVIMINRYNKLLEKGYSDTDNRNLTWVKVIIGAMIGLIIAYFGIGKYFNMEGVPGFQSLYFIGTEILLIIIAYYVDKQKDVDEYMLEEADTSPDSAGNENYGIYSRNEIGERLKYMFEEKKLYTKANLTIKDLAEILGSNSKYVSLFLNNVKGKNFNQYINALRIREGCTIMKTDRIISFDDLATTVGFNSKVTFWRIFQVEMNCTPAEYRNMLMGNVNDITGTEEPTITAKQSDITKTSERKNEAMTTEQDKYNFSTLSPREKELCRLIIDGTTTDIQCEKLGVRQSSLRVMRSRLRKRLQLGQRDNLPIYLVQHKDFLT